MNQQKLSYLFLQMNSSSITLLDLNVSIILTSVLQSDMGINIGFKFLKKFRSEKFTLVDHTGGPTNGLI